MKKLAIIPAWQLALGYLVAVVVLTVVVGRVAQHALELPPNSRATVIARDEVFWTPLQLQLGLEHLSEESELFAMGQADKARLQERLEMVQSKAGILLGAAARASAVGATPEFREVLERLPVFMRLAQKQVSEPTPASLRQMRDNIDELMASLTSLATSARAAGLAAQTAREAALERGRAHIYSGCLVGWLLFCALGLQAVLAWQRSTVTRMHHESELAGLRRSLELVRKAETIRNTYLASVSHEINSPLQAILTNVQLMESRLGDPKGIQRIVARLNASVSHLRGQVHDLLDVAEINSGKMRVKFGEVDLARLVTEVVAVQQSAAENKSLRLTLNTHNLQVVRSDGRRLTQILTNLVTNAIRYTEAGSIEVHASIKQVNPTQSVICLSVTDTGIGFAPEVLENLYQPFMPVMKHRAGSGLGLAIVKGLVDQLSGTIELKTKLGRGSSFMLKIPVTVVVGATGTAWLSSEPTDVPDSPDMADTSDIVTPEMLDTQTAPRDVDPHGTTEGTTEPQRHLLFVEDDPDIQATMAEMLELLGYVCYPASSMQEGLKRLTERKYCAIVVDMELGDGTGLEVARAAKSTINQAAPLVVCTAYSDLLDQPGMEIFDARFRKPVDATALRDMLTRLVNTEPVHG
jgi:signal transduction histidine kinase